MSIPLEEFLKSGLGDDAVIMTASGPVDLKGKFSSKYKVAKMLSLDNESARAQMKCLSSDVDGLRVGDQITIYNKGSFYIGEIQPMGSNVSILVLTND